MSQQTNPVPNQQPAFDVQGAPLQDPTQPAAMQPYVDAQAPAQANQSAQSAQQPAQATQPVVQQGFDAQGAPVQQPLDQAPDGQGAVIGQGAPTQNGQIKDPEDWATGDQPMTDAQRSYLDSLAKQAGETLPANLTKAQASEHIDRLQQATGTQAAPQQGQGGTIGA